MCEHFYCRVCQAAVARKSCHEARSRNCELITIGRWIDICPNCLQRRQVQRNISAPQNIQSTPAHEYRQPPQQYGYRQQSQVFGHAQPFSQVQNSQHHHQQIGHTQQQHPYGYTQQQSDAGQVRQYQQAGQVRQAQQTGQARQYLQAKHVQHQQPGHAQQPAESPPAHQYQEFPRVEHPKRTMTALNQPRVPERSPYQQYAQTPLQTKSPQTPHTPQRLQTPKDSRTTNHVPQRQQSCVPQLSFEEMTRQHENRILVYARRLHGEKAKVEVAQYASQGAEEENDMRAVLLLTDEDGNQEVIAVGEVKQTWAAGVIMLAKGYVPYDGVLAGSLDGLHQ